MKKNVRKLTLHRETIRTLERSDFRHVMGAAVTINDTSCACEEATHCECASEGGTDCYPHSACFGTCSC